MKNSQQLFTRPFLALASAILFMILSSPKWTVVFAPWLGITFFLYFSRKAKFWPFILFGLAGLYFSGIVSLYEVIPFPLPILVIIMLITALKSILPYLVDRLAKAEKRGFIGTLIFPAAFVSLEYLNMLERGDVWSSIANTQYSFQSLLQIASIFGIWGISFLIAWFASLVNWMAELNWQWKRIKTGAIVAGSVYIMAIAFGFIRMNNLQADTQNTVEIAGITMDNSNIMQSMYYDEFGKPLTIDPEISQTSPILQEANRAMEPFLNDPFADKFERTLRVMKENRDYLFNKTEQVANDGAKVVVWSEGIGMVLNSQEDAMIQRAKEMAKKKSIYLFMPLAVINPGPIDPNRLMMINKTITFTPEGEIANVYLKSNPVPFAEQEYGSDDIIPIIDGSYGKLSPVICYDASFPRFMRQTGKLGTDILLIPSGDWHAIDPYHAYMAVLRGIENGTNIVRPVSRATSIATDVCGNILGSNSFFDSQDKTMVAQVPTQGTQTIYNQIGDILSYLSFIITGFVLLNIFVGMAKRKKRQLNID